MSPPSHHHHSHSISSGDVLRVLHSVHPHRLAASTISRKIIAATDTSMARASMNERRVWNVPADIVGLDSKKSKQAKVRRVVCRVVRIR